MKNIGFFFSENVQFLEVKFSVYLNRRVFVMYIVKLGFTGVYIILLISSQNIDCGYSLGPPRSNDYPQSMF